jgi:DNA invertase Pin-like site-specific DNA recombinase
MRFTRPLPAVNSISSWLGRSTTTPPRLGRSLKDLVNFLDELRALNVDLFLRTQGINTTSPSGKAMFGMLSVFADFERSIIQERVRAGLARAKDEGKTLGRPKIAADIETAIRTTLAGGTGMLKTARLHSVGVGTVQRIAHAASVSGSS